jgi:hypothetical protein
MNADWRCDVHSCAQRLATLSLKVGKINVTFSANIQRLIFLL